MKFRLKRESVNSYTVLRDDVAIGRFEKSWNYNWETSLFGLNLHQRYFPTRREAYAWLRMMGKNPKIAEHLSRLTQYTMPMPIMDTINNFQQMCDDKGFFDKMKNFVDAQGYPVIHSPVHLSLFEKPDDVWGYYYYNPFDNPKGVIYVRRHPSRLYMSHLLTHEFVHAYETSLGIHWKRSGGHREQLADGVASAILYDYNLDTTEYARNYMAFHGGRGPFSIYGGGLDSDFSMLYTNISREIAAHMKEA